MRLSATTIKDSNECILKAYWGNVTKPIKVPPNHFGMLGSLLHWIIKETIEHKMFDQWGIIKGMYTERYSNQFLKNKEVEAPDNERFYWDGLNLLYKWKTDFLKRGWDDSETLMLENYFRIPISNDLQFSGYVDYLMKYEDEIYLIDWKSNKYVPTSEEIQDNIQLSMYYWASTKFNLEAKHVGLYFLRTNEYVSVTRDENDVDSLMEQGFNINEKFSKNELEANFSAENCKWCGFKEICTAWEKEEKMYYSKKDNNFSPFEEIF